MSGQVSKFCKIDFKLQFSVAALCLQPLQRTIVFSKTWNITTFSSHFAKELTIIISWATETKHFFIDEKICSVLVGSTHF